MKPQLPRFLSVIFLVLLLSSPHGFAVTDMGGVGFEDKARVGDADLILNGVGLRSMFVIRIYVVGLYLPRRAGDGVQAIAMRGPKRIRLVTLRDVEAARFLEGLMKGLGKNHSATELAALKSRSDLFAERIKSLGHMAKGGTVDLDQLSDGATRLAFNGEPVGEAIPGEDFYRALLKIWLGDKPAQYDLKTGLLGG